jgi:O-antigen/teichoic acid export membrane protein
MEAGRQADRRGEGRENGAAGDLPMFGKNGKRDLPSLGKKSGNLPNLGKTAASPPEEENGGGGTGLLRGGALLMAGNLFGAACNMGFHMVAGRRLPDEEYGALVAMLGVILVAGKPMEAVQNTVAHYTARFDAAGEREKILPFVGALGRWLGWVALVLMAAALVGGKALAGFWGPPVTPGLVLLTAAVLGGSLFMPAFNGVQQGLQAFGYMAVAPQGWGFFRLVLTWALVAAGAATAVSGMTAQGVGVLSVLAAGVWFFRRERLPGGNRAEAPAGCWRYLLANFACLAGYGALMNLDATLAKHYFDPVAAGVFGKAATIARTAIFLPAPFVAVVFSKVSAAAGRRRAARAALWQGVGLTAAFLAAVVAGCAVLPWLPWRILYGGVPDAAGLGFAPMRLTLAMLVAQAPLALAAMLLHYQMARRRFAGGLALLLCAAAYVLGVACFHRAAWQIALCLGAANIAAFVCLLPGLRERGAAEA